MTDLNKEYFFVLKPSGDHVPFLVPDADTEGKSDGVAPQPPGSPPLVFLNAWRDENRKAGVFAQANDVMFSGADLLVRSAIREALLDLAIPRLTMAPAIFIDDEGQRHEDYWFLTFTDRFDCWDRATSEYDEDTPPVMVRGMPNHAVATYSLDRELMAKTALKDRLLFKMGADIMGFVVCHESLASLLGGAGDRGAKLVSLADY